MNQESPVELRITDLEIKISYAEDLVDELNRVVYRQQQQIDLLATQLKDLREQAKSDALGEKHSQRDELPPHY